MDATLHIRLDSDLRDELEYIAENNDTKISAIIREALEDYCSRNIEISGFPREDRNIV